MRSSEPAHWQVMSSQTWMTRGGLRLDGEHRVEGGDAVGVGRRNGQSAAELVESTGADPTDPLLQGPERREQQVSALPGVVAGARRVSLGPGETLPAVPAVSGRAENGVEGCTLGGGRLGSGEEMDVH